MDQPIARSGATASRGGSQATVASRPAPVLQRTCVVRPLLVPLLRRARRRDAADRRAARRKRGGHCGIGGNGGRRCRAPAARAGEPRTAAAAGRSRCARARVVSARCRTRSWSGSAGSSARTASRSSRVASRRSPSARPERPFAFEHDGVLLHGRLDVLQLEGESAVVIDYKTNSLAEGTPEEIVENDYHLQRLVYALACFRAGARRWRSCTTSSSARTQSSRPCSAPSRSPSSRPS